MRLERLNYNKIKIFLTFDDLMERGLSKEDLWQDVPKVHQLFREMMDEANVELGFEADGPVAVEVFSLQAQGMVVIVTKGSNEETYEEDDFDEDYIEMQVTLDESFDIFYEFASIEDVISLSVRLFQMGISGGTFSTFENYYFLELKPHELSKVQIDDMISILAEYGSSSTITTHRVYEYGKVLMKDNAIEQINHFFVNKK